MFVLYHERYFCLCFEQFVAFRGKLNLICSNHIFWNFYRNFKKRFLRKLFVIYTVLIGFNLKFLNEHWKNNFDLNCFYD